MVQTCPWPDADLHLASTTARPERPEHPDRVGRALCSSIGRRLAVLEVEGHQPEHVLLGRVGHEHALELLRMGVLAPRKEGEIDTFLYYTNITRIMLKVNRHTRFLSGNNYIFTTSQTKFISLMQDVQKNE